jgi:hypothetical protein
LTVMPASSVQENITSEGFRLALQEISKNLSGRLFQRNPSPLLLLGIDSKPLVPREGSFDRSLS